MERKIGITTTDFGFGPVSKSLYIIEELKKKNPNMGIVFYGEGYSKEYIESSDIEVEIKSKSEMETDSEVWGIINVMDTDTLAGWKNPDKKMYFVDSLAWMWDKPVEGIEKISKYFVQDYLIKDGLIDELSQYTEVEVVAPITKKIEFVDDKSKRLVVNYSGVHNPFTPKDFFVNYCSKITEIILKYADGCFDEIVFSMNSEVARDMEKIFDAKKYNSVIRFGFLSHEEFIKLICSADRVITNPGITTTLELVRNNCAFAYLFGSNYSQCLITHKYQHQYGMSNVFSFEDLGFDTTSIMGIPEEEGVKAVSKFLEQSLKKLSVDFENYIKEIINIPREELMQNNKNIPVNMKDFGQKVIVDSIIEDMVS